MSALEFHLVISVKSSSTIARGFSFSLSWEFGIGTINGHWRREKATEVDFLHMLSS